MGLKKDGNRSDFVPLNYNPVPASRRNIQFFRDVMEDKTTSKMREVLSSGCPPIKLDNGAAVCNPSNRQCRVVCRFGHTMAGFGVAFKVCNIITGNWMPQPIPRCVRDVGKSKRRFDDPSSQVRKLGTMRIQRERKQPKRFEPFEEEDEYSEKKTNTKKKNMKKDEEFEEEVKLIQFPIKKKIHTKRINGLSMFELL